jgi:RNA polymerase sigma-70 factor (family 1)
MLCLVLHRMYLVSDTDHHLLSALQKGDEAAFRVLYEKYWADVYTTVYRRIGDEDDAKDIVQNIFMNVWFMRESILAEDSLAPWLKVAARTKSISYFKKKMTELHRNFSFHQEQSDSNSPELNFEVKELESVFDREIARMPEIMRNSFLLSRRENKSIREIAAELSLSEQTIKNNISQALARLRKKSIRFYTEPVNLVWIIILVLTKN